MGILALNDTGDLINLGFLGLLQRGVKRSSDMRPGKIWQYKRVSYVRHRMFYVVNDLQLASLRCHHRSD